MAVVKSPKNTKRRTLWITLRSKKSIPFSSSSSSPKVSKYLRKYILSVIAMRRKLIFLAKHSPSLLTNFTFSKKFVRKNVNVRNYTNKLSKWNRRACQYSVYSFVKKTSL